MADPTDKFLDWLIAMDDPQNREGMEARQTVTLTQIIQHARDLKLYRELAAGDHAGDHECDIPPGLTDSDTRRYECPVCGAHWTKVKRMVGRTMYRSWHRMSDEQVRRMKAERQNVRPA